MIIPLWYSTHKDKSSLPTKGKKKAVEISYSLQEQILIMIKEIQIKSREGTITSFTLKASWEKEELFSLLRLNKPYIGLSKSGTIILNIALDFYWCIDTPCRCVQIRFL